ncbi:MAG: hypothetical protein HY234_07350 [Acidobacteria bacterium]|nr:hypothetical protein [Acidobacteriota bacterium]MBI3662850.1 hypothetical protein [Acidobacteriota bacterium]
MSEESAKAPPVLHPALSLLVAVAAWAVPGLGHLLLRRWGRAFVYFLGVSTFALLGLALRGHVFSLQAGDAFELLGFLSNLGAGAYYFVAKYLATAAPDVSRAAGDYGTRFFAAAGVLNLLCVLDAVDIASGRKE